MGKKQVTDIQSSSVLTIKTIRVLKKVQIQKQRTLDQQSPSEPVFYPSGKALEDVIFVSFPNFKKRYTRERRRVISYVTFYPFNDSNSILGLDSRIN